MNNPWNQGLSDDELQENLLAGQRAAQFIHDAATGSIDKATMQSKQEEFIQYVLDFVSIVQCIVDSINTLACVEN